MDIERTMPEFLNQLQKAMTEYGLQNHAVLLAVSGGPDSVSLLRGLYSLRKQMQLTLSAAHFNHQLRGEESNRDALWLKSLCSELDVSLTIGSEDVRTVALLREQALKRLPENFVMSFCVGRPVNSAVRLLPLHIQPMIKWKRSCIISSGGQDYRG
ncbi:MAG: hypothetical protein IH899_19095 [Planctomycetes bacterium]|nr:hypothetical protein [Planctomycetota bacterium]